MSSDSPFPLRIRQAQSSVSALPVPEAAALEHSEQLINLIRSEITAQGGAIPFYQFMELALYAPGLGYYSAGCNKLGPEGDFITAPEIAPLFSRCLANAIQPVLATLPIRQILEAGAGSGVMAADLLAELAVIDPSPVQYSILERSADLQARQKETVWNRIPLLSSQLEWLTTLPDKMTGIILANELLDAMPVHRVTWQQGQLQESYVGMTDNEFTWQIGPLSDTRLKTRFEQFTADNYLPDGYITEINLAAEDWIRTIGDRLEQGMVVLIDYGFSQHEYYHPQRHQGTLMCHYRHRGHDNPFRFVGLQDITAHVDFTAIADAALELGMKVAGYTTQAHFLLGSGLTNLAAQHQASTEEQLDMANQVRRLTLPQEMGEIFKVMILTKDLTVSMPGLMLHDMRGKL